MAVANTSHRCSAKGKTCGVIEWYSKGPDLGGGGGHDDVFGHELAADVQQRLHCSARCGGRSSGQPLTSFSQTLMIYLRELKRISHQQNVKRTDEEVIGSSRDGCNCGIGGAMGPTAVGKWLLAPGANGIAQRNTCTAALSQTCTHRM